MASGIYTTATDLAVKNHTFKNEKPLLDAFNYAKSNNKNVHFLGLVSDGGVHSHINHLKGLLTAAQEFGLTENVYLVITANIFALMGLRQLYFLLGGLLERLEYLKYGIAFILAFIGVKLFFHAMHVNELPFINGGQHIEWAPEISTWMSLGVIVAAMIVATVASLIKAGVDARRRGHTLMEEVPHFTED